MPAPGPSESSGSGDLVVTGVSIPVPAPYGDDLQRRRRSYGDPLADVTPAHVTLLGPTEIRRDELPAFRQHLAATAAAVQPFTMVLRGTGTFRPVSDVVFVQVAHGISRCEQLERAIRSGPWRQKLTFPYHPHVTVAHKVPGPALDRAFEDLAHFSATFEVEAFWLYHQGGSGAWVPQQAFALGAPTTDAEEH